MSSVVLAQLLDASPDRKKKMGSGWGGTMHYFSMTDGLCQRNWNILHKVYAIYVAFSSV